MTKRTKNPLDSLSKDPRVREAAQNLLDVVAGVAAGHALEPKAYENAVQEIGRRRGRPLPFPLLSAQSGKGARVRLADGTTKLDFIGGIGVYGFGHCDADLMETAVVTAARDAVFQGHLMPGPEYLTLSRALVRQAGRRMPHCWLSVSGADANENALKLIYQRHAPAERIVAFSRAFAGRTLAMAEITDKPEFREGLPNHGNVHYIPFYDPDDPDSTQKAVTALDIHLKHYPKKIAAVLFELVQGEGGIRTAPREFFVALMTRCKEAGLAVWVDEVQTFGRTGELFAFKTLGLEEYVDVVTVGKMLQGSAVLFTKRYNPRPGLIAGTYAGSSVGMAVGARIIERMEEEGYLGAEGRVAVLGRRVEKRIASLRKRMPKAVGAHSGIGAMHALVPFDGSPEIVRDVLAAAYEEGLLLFSAGQSPTKLRMLLPVNTTDEELEAGFAMLEKAMRHVGDEKNLPC